MSPDPRLSELPYYGHAVDLCCDELGALTADTFLGRRDKLIAVLRNAAAVLLGGTLQPQDEEEKADPRVAPLTAGVDVQELPRRSPPGAVTAAERPEKDRWMNCQQRISNRCPACGNQTLFIAVGGWLTCSWLKCPAPCAIGNLADHHR